MPSYKIIIPAIASFFVPIYGLLISVGVVIALDTFTGVFKTIKLNGWKSFNSKRLSDVIGKIILYTLCVLCVFALDKTLLGEFLKLWFSIPLLATKAVTLVIVFVELTSIKENIESALKINLFNLIKSALTRGKELKDDAKQLV